MQAVDIGYQFWQDYIRFLATSHPAVSKYRWASSHKDSIEANLTILYHSLEKGSVIPVRRIPFGLEKARLLQKGLIDARAIGVSETCIASSVSALEDLSRLNAGCTDEEISISVQRGELQNNFDWYQSFVESRHSVRRFDSERPVPSELVADAVELASLTPSVCNRRAFRAHYLDSRDSIDIAMQLQDGNTGFGYQVPGVIVVTVRRAFFIGAKERNQRWIDGGLFAMNVMWALHAKGLATCFLNWAERNARTELLKKALGIPGDEDVVVLIALGYAHPMARVTRSPRRPIDETFVRITQ